MTGGPEERPPDAVHILAGREWHEHRINELERHLRQQSLLIETMQDMIDEGANYMTALLSELRLVAKTLHALGLPSAVEETPILNEMIAEL